jgi:hypothetical protein
MCRELRTKWGLTKQDVQVHLLFLRQLYFDLVCSFITTVTPIFLIIVHVTFIVGMGTVALGVYILGGLDVDHVVVIGS